SGAIALAAKCAREQHRLQEGREKTLRRTNRVGSISEADVNLELFEGYVPPVDDIREVLACDAAVERDRHLEPRVVLVVEICAAEKHVCVPLVHRGERRAFGKVVADSEEQPLARGTGVATVEVDREI